MKCKQNNIFLLRIRAEYLLDKFSGNHVAFTFPKVVVKGAQMGLVLASDWFSPLLTGSATADRWLLRG